MLAGGLEFPVIARFVAWIPSGIKNGFSESSWMRTVCLAFDMRLPPPNRNLAWAAESREVGKNSASPLGIESVEKIPRPSSAFSILDVVFRSLVFLPRESPIYEKINDLALDPPLKSERIAQIAKRLGQQPDYLNRRFKKVLGLTLRCQHRGANRLEQYTHPVSRGARSPRWEFTLAQSRSGDQRSLADSRVGKSINPQA